VAACGGGDASGSPGLASMLLTDAAPEEISEFEVDVADIELQRLGGAMVSVLPRHARVDFAALESVSELMVAGAVPAGAYVGLTMTLDFSTASVYLQGKTTPATILDENGAVLTGEVPVRVGFPGAALPNVFSGRHHMFVLDLDLAQAVAVDSTLNQVTFSPVLHAQVDPAAPKPVALQGHVNAVDVAAQTLMVEKRDVDDVVIGVTTVHVNSNTVCQIDGVVSMGGAGLTALTPLLASNPKVYVQGVLDHVSDASMTAVAIESGYGTIGNGQDWLVGHVVGRSAAAGGDTTLTVFGHSFDEPSAMQRFATTHTVRVSKAATKVLRRGASNTLDTDAINVGQAIAAFGTFDTGTTDLDATTASGVVRCLRTSVFGTSVGTPSGSQMTLNVTRIGLLPISSFNFTVAGNAQSNAAAFTVDTTGQSVAGVSSGTKIRAIGWINPVDVSGDADLESFSYVNHTTSANVMLAQWSTGSLGSLTVSPGSLWLPDIATSQVGIVADGFSTTTLGTLPMPSMVPALPFGIYRIVEGGQVSLFFDYDEFSADLYARLAAAQVFRVAGLGAFDGNTQELSALVISVVLK
jgi:hypothetical protein